MSESTWKKEYRWVRALRVCGYSVADGSPVYDHYSGYTNRIKKTEDETWVDTRTGFQIERLGDSYILSHPSLNESDERVFKSFDDAANGIWEFTTINVYCDWHRRPEFQSQLRALAFESPNQD
jgi:hypothetical protein